MSEILKRAHRVYFTRFGETAPRPSADLSGVERSGLSDPCEHVVLRNVNGEVARYRIRANLRLRFVESEP